MHRHSHRQTYLSTNIPAWTACTMLRKRGFSSLRRSIRPIWRVKVEANQSRTSEGTDSDWMSLSSSSVSTRRLADSRTEFQRLITLVTAFTSASLQLQRHIVQLASSRTTACSMTLIALPFKPLLWRRLDSLFKQTNRHLRLGVVHTRSACCTIQISCVSWTTLPLTQRWEVAKYKFYLSSNLPK